MQPTRRNTAIAQDGPYRYQELANFITRLVEAGTLPPGSRVPSLRQIGRQRGTSLATALQAYRLLEDRGVLEACPQSGFYSATSRYGHCMRFSCGTPWSTRIERGLETLGRLISDAPGDRPGPLHGAIARAPGT